MPGLAPNVTSLVVGSTALEVEIVLDEINVDLTVGSTGGLQVGDTPEVAAILILGPAGPRGPTGPRGGTSKRQEVFDDGNASCSLSQAADLSSVQVFRNGLSEIPGVGFDAVDSSGSTIVTFSEPPLVTDIIVVTYNAVEG